MKREHEPRNAADLDATPSFVISEKADFYRRTFHPGATEADWNNWPWQMRNRIRTFANLAKHFKLSEDEFAASLLHDAQKSAGLPLAITPYYASLMDRDDPIEPLRRSHSPVVQEKLRMPGEADDPLGEDGHTAVAGVVHRYPDRVLFLLSSTCATLCRSCTRSRITFGMPGGKYRFSTNQWETALAYIKAHPEIRDVLLSGGDPLTLSDEQLDWLLRRLRAIPHVEIIRIGTKVPVVLPMRVTLEFLRMLRRHHPIWMSINVTHPAELTPEATQALARLADAGIPLGSQTVLLKGINDDIGTMKDLMHGLMLRRVRPYYLYQCDPISGSAHFRTPVAKGLEIIEGLRGHTTGYAVPTFVIDAPGGGGKIPLMPNYVVARSGNDLVLRNYAGELFHYPDSQQSED